MADYGPLSEREVEILRLVATGASNKEIARQLSISTNTVKVYVRNIFAKIGVQSRTEAAYRAIQDGLIEGGPALEYASTGITRTDIAHHRRNLWITGLVGILLLAAIAGASWRRFQGRPQPTQNQPVESISRWKGLAPLPEARAGLAAAALDGRVIVIGGETEVGISAEVDSYDPAADRWVRLPDKPTAVADIQAAVIGGLIYVPGGRVADGSVTDVLEVFDPSTRDWGQAAPVPQAVSGYGLATHEGRLYLMGGWDGQAVLASGYSYNPDTDVWSALTPMPTARAFAGAAVAGGVLYVIGGSDGNIPLAATEHLPLGASGTAGSMKWSAGTPLPEPRSGMAVISAADILYLIGADSLPPPRGVLELLPGQDRWTPLEDLPVPGWSGFGAARLGPHIILVGGTLDGRPTDQVASFQAIYSVLIPAVP